MPDPIKNAVVLTDDADGSGGGTHYPCVQLDDSVYTEFVDRESFVEIGEGHEPIYARVWMTVAQFGALPSGFRAGTGTLGIIMKGNSNDYPATLQTPARGAQTLQFSKAFYLLGARVARIGRNHDLYEVRLTTMQHFWKFFQVTGGSAGHLAYNVLSDDKDSYEFGSTDPTTPKTLQAIVTDLKGDLGIGPALTLPFTPAFTLNNLFMDKGSAGENLARILRPIGCHLVADPYSDLTKLTYSIAQLDYTDPTDEDDDLANLASVAIYEGTSTTSGGSQSQNIDGSVSPEKVKVRFPVWPTPTGSNPRWTTKTVNNPLSGSGGGTFIEGTFDVINAGDRYDLSGSGGSGGATYTQDLTAIANARGAYYFGRANIPYNCQIFSGGYPILPGNTIRRVRISMDNDGWFTTVWRHGLWDHPREDGAYDSYVHQWLTQHRAPQFPELGEQNGQGFFQRDDGTFEPWGMTGSPVIVELGAAVADQPGRYAGLIVKELIKTTNTTSRLTLSDLGTPLTVCVVWHLPEIIIDAPKSLLYPGTLYLGRRVARDVHGKPIVLIGVLPVGEITDPKLLIGTGADAHSVDWNRSNDGRPVRIKFATREPVWSATDGVFYGYSSVVSCDACGLVIDVTAEEREVIFAWPECVDVVYDIQKYQVAALTGVSVAAVTAITSVGYTTANVVSSVGYTTAAVVTGVTVTCNDDGTITASVSTTDAIVAISAPTTAVINSISLGGNAVVGSIGFTAQNVLNDVTLLKTPVTGCPFTP